MSKTIDKESEITILSMLTTLINKLHSIQNQVSNIHKQKI